MEDYTDAFGVTPTFLAFMLGVLRGIAGALQRSPLIEYSRGLVIVLNRKGLLAASCGCYADKPTPNCCADSWRLNLDGPRLRRLSVQTVQCQPHLIMEPTQSAGK
jgi:hypothetical protein